MTSNSYIAAGIKVSVREVGGNWIQGSGYVEQTGVNKYLYASEDILVGDFTLQATLSLMQLNSTGASFDLAGNRIGLDGFGNTFFTEGVDWGATQFHGPASNYITPGSPFILKVVRTGSNISFMIDGNTIVTRELNSGSLANAGFRPWRNTMRIFDFYRDGGKVSNQFFSDTIVFTNGTNGYDNFRIPTIVRAGNGNLLAFAEGRSTDDDFGNIDIVMRRSTDNGLSWEPLVIVSNNGELVAGNPGVVVDINNNNKIILVYNTGNTSEDNIMVGNGVREAWVTTSTDHGHNWSLPVNITTLVHRPNQPGYNRAYSFPLERCWRWHAILPGHAIQLNNGRLIFGANFRMADGDAQSFVFYSDDHGSTWQIGGVAGKPGNECTLVQLTNGNIMMNARRFPPIDPANMFRQVSISTNNGINFSSFQDDTQLPEPSCQASLIRFTTNPTSRILFSNPANQSDRTNLTVRVSYDECKTWTYSRIVNPIGAYSDLVIEADNKTIGLLYESNGISSICYARFNIEWLTNSQDSIA